MAESYMIMWHPAGTPWEYAWGASSYPGKGEAFWAMLEYNELYPREKFRLVKTSDRLADFEQEVFGAA